MEDFKKRIKEALYLLLKNDNYLITTNINERTISYKLAYYIQNIFPDWNVDCEYNRDYDEIKRLPQIPVETITNADVKGTTIYPDIIIHLRGTSKNLLIIEVKKNATNKEKEKDILKIKRIMEHFGYNYGLFINFNTKSDDNNTIEEMWFR